MKKNLVLLSLVSLLAASSAFASVKYSCLPAGDSDIQDDVTLTVVSGKVVHVGDDVARLDEKYEPRLNNGFERFEYDQSDEGVSEVLVQERLLNGARSGFIKIQNRGQTFDSQKLSCKVTN